MKHPSNDVPTIKAVILYAEKLKLNAERQTVGDVYAKPYWPPMMKDGKISEQALKKLIQRVGSPEHALEFLRLKAAQADREAREEAQASQRALERHARRQGHHKRNLAERRSASAGFADRQCPGGPFDDQFGVCVGVGWGPCAWRGT